MWKTGNAEARMLALQVADPQKMTEALADKFLADGPVQFLGLYLAIAAATRIGTVDVNHGETPLQDARSGFLYQESGGACEVAPAEDRTCNLTS